MAGDRVRVAPCDRAGQGGVTEPQRVVQCRAEQRPEHPARVRYSGRVQQVRRLDDQGDQVIGGAGERRVVEVPVLLVDEHRLAAHLDHQRLGHRAQR